MVRHAWPVSGRSLQSVECSHVARRRYRASLYDCDTRGHGQEKPLQDWPEFTAAIQQITESAPPLPPSPAPAPSASAPFKVGEQLGSLRKKLPALKKEVGERLGSLRKKVSGLKKDEVVARIRQVGKILFGVLCWLLIESWAVCLATKDQTVRLAAYSVKRFKAWRAGKATGVEPSSPLWPSDRTGWRRIRELVIVSWSFCLGWHFLGAGTSRGSHPFLRPVRLIRPMANRARRSHPRTLVLAARRKARPRNSLWTSARA